jgi:hypothetical protein
MNPSGRAEQTPRSRGSNLAWRLLTVLLLVVLVVAFLWNLGAEDRAIARMEPVHRREVYERALGEVRLLCGTSPRTDALEKRCAEQIQFILKFPECDGTCQDIARSHEPLPTK